jgi:large subunit ribosomal protein L15
MDIGVIDQIVPSLLAQGIAKKEGDVVVINAADINIGKVLGSGRVRRKLNISAQAFSGQAKIKIEKMGGRATVL